MDLNTQRQKADAFRRMHDRSRILVLVNVWDAMSARAVEEAGARATPPAARRCRIRSVTLTASPHRAVNSSPQSRESRAQSRLP